SQPAAHRADPDGPHPIGVRAATSIEKVRRGGARSNIRATSIGDIRRKAAFTERGPKSYGLSATAAARAKTRRELEDMNAAKLGVFGLLASAAALYGFTGDTSPSKAPAASAQVNDFLLVDQNFEAHQLYRLADAKAVVLVTQANGDSVIRGLAPQLKALKAKYGPQGVEFFLLNSKYKFETVKPEAEKAGYDWPVLIDDNQIIGESLGVTRS